MENLVEATNDEGAIHFIATTNITNRLLLVKCHDNKKIKSPYNWVISPLTQPQVANQQKNKKNLSYGYSV